MFISKLLSDEKGFRNPQSSGVRFGYLGEPLKFDFLEDVSKERTVVEILVDVDKSKSDFLLELNDKIPGLIKISFFNPSRPGISGISRPKALLVSGDRILAIMFWVDFRENDIAYKLSFEFYDEDKTLLDKKEVSNEGL